MKRIGFALKGETFLRALGTLIYFSNSCGIKPIIVCSRKRLGKTYDNMKKDTIKKCLPKNFELYWIDSDKEFNLIFSKLEIEAVVCQDAQWHFKNLIQEFRVYSISMFFDTLHYVSIGEFNKDFIPYRTYFHNEKFRDEVCKRSNFDWPSAVIQNPSLDHSIFCKPNEEEGGILFLSPPTASLPSGFITELEKAIDWCEKKKIPFIIKDRKKFPWKQNNHGHQRVVRNEDAFPYTSMKLLMSTDVHLTCYGTSVVESFFLRKPAINIPAIKNKQGSNHLVASYGFDELYNNELCTPFSGNLVEDIKVSLTKKVSFSPKISFEHNNSMHILYDVLRNEKMYFDTDERRK